MRVLYKATKDTGFRELVVPNDLHAMQELVGGHIEAVTIAEDATLLCNGEGRILQLEFNCEYYGIDFFGPIMIVGTDGDEFCDCPMSVLMANGGINQ